MYALGHRVLDSFSKSQALEGFFFWAVRGLAENRSKLRTDLDAFAHARRSQAAEALAQTWAGVVKLSVHLRGTSAEEAPTRPVDDK
jgi:hypothetical protein